MPGAAKAREPSDHPGTAGGSVNYWPNLEHHRQQGQRAHTLPTARRLTRLCASTTDVLQCGHRPPESMLEMDPMLISRREDKPHARCTRWGPAQLSEFATENRHETKTSPHKPNVHHTDTGRTSLWPRREEADALFLDFGAGPCVFSSRAFGVLGPTCAFPYRSDNSVPTWKRGRGVNA